MNVSKENIVAQFHEKATLRAGLEEFCGELTESLTTRAFVRSLACHAGAHVTPEGFARVVHDTLDLRGEISFSGALLLSAVSARFGELVKAVLLCYADGFTSDAEAAWKKHFALNHGRAHDDGAATERVQMQFSCEALDLMTMSLSLKSGRFGEIMVNYHCTMVLSFTYGGCYVYKRAADGSWSGDWYSEGSVIEIPQGTPYAYVLSDCLIAEKETTLIRMSVVSAPPGYQSQCQSLGPFSPEMCSQTQTVPE